MTEETQPIEELLNKPRGHSPIELFKEVHRQSCMNFFTETMTKRYPGTPLYELRENKTELVFELLHDNEISEPLAANLLEMDMEEFKEKFAQWLDEKSCEGDECKWTR